MRAPVYVSQQKQRNEQFMLWKEKNSEFFDGFCFCETKRKKHKRSLCHMVEVTSKNDALERMIHASWLGKCAGIDEVLSAYRKLIEYW
jgi:hypothetical protein